MILEGPNDPIFAGFNPEATYPTALPEITKNTYAGFSSADIQRTIQKFVAEDGSAVIRKVGGLAALQFGVAEVEKFRKIYDLLESISPVDLLQSTGVFRQIDVLVTDVLAQVPYLRWAIAVGRLVANLVDYASRTADVPPDTALSYSPGDNTTALEVLQGRMQSEDWSSIFLPCQTTPTWVHEGIENAAGMPGFLGKGVRIKVAGGAPFAECDGMGLLPGLADQDGGVYEYPYEMPPNPDGLTLGQGPVITSGLGDARGGFGWPTTPINTTGTQRPLLRQAAAALWQRVMKPSPETFMVDTRDIAEKWGVYYQSLRQFGEIRPGRSGYQIGVQALAASIAVKYGWDDGLVIHPQSRFPGVAFVGEKTRAGKGKLEVRVRPRIIKDRSSLTDIGGTEYVVYRMVERLRAMQHYALSRTVVAYVSPNAPALLDKELSDRHEKMRQLLLEHPAICDVDLDMIPDNTYRTAATEAQERMKCFLGPSGILGNGDGQAHRAAPPLDKTPEPPGAQGGPPGGGEGGGGGGAVAVALIAAALAGMALL